MFTATICNKVKIQLIYGDILKCRGTAIVNSANSSLSHSGGVALAISRAAGLRLDQECGIYLQNYGTLQVGRATTTTAGDIANYQHVIHVVVPIYDETKLQDKMRKDFISGVMRVLEEAEKINAKSITMTPLGVGIFSWPSDIAAECQIEAIKSYLEQRPDSSLRKIIIVDLDQKVLPDFERKLREITNQKLTQLDDRFFFNIDNSYDWQFYNDKSVWQNYDRDQRNQIEAAYRYIYHDFD